MRHEERVRKGELIMSKARLIALAGPLSVLVGTMWLLAAIGNSILLDSDETFIVFWSYSFLLSFIPMLFALIGNRLRFHQFVGSVGRLGLALGVAGCAGVIIFTLANILLSRAAPVPDQPFWVNYVAVACVLSIRIGYILFGVDALRHRLLPHWNLLPLLLGSTLVLGLPLDWFGVPAFLPLPPHLNIAFLHFAITGVCWVLLGVAMMAQRREPQPTAAS
jgi:hypothetical protein